MSRYHFSDWVRTTRVPRRVFVAQARWRGRKALARGELVEGMTRLLQAWKQGWPDPVPPALAARVTREIDIHCRDGAGKLKPLADNAFLRAWVGSEAARLTRSDFAAYPFEDRVRLRTPRSDAPAKRQGDCVLYKPHDPATGEKGLLYITYNHGAAWLPSLYDLPALAQKYIIALEPSTWGYMDFMFMPYIGADLDVIVEAQNTVDFDFIEGLGTNLVPTRLGAGDWADPSQFHPKPLDERQFDVVMVGAWDPLKRHDLLFRAVADISRRTRPLRVGLVGYDMTWTQQDVASLAEKHGIADQVTYLSKVPYAQVTEMLCDARVGVLLSKREGANRGIYECWMADVPTLVYKHHRGVNLDQIVPENGLLVDDHELAAGIEHLLGRPAPVAPRAWALKNTGSVVATRRLNELCRELSARRGLPWTRDCVERTYWGYVAEADRIAMNPHWAALGEHLLPVEARARA